MLRRSAIVADYQDAGSVNKLLAIWGFVDDHTFITKAGHLGVLYRLASSDPECLDASQRRDVVHAFEGGLRLLDEHCRLYQYAVRSRLAPVTAASCTDPVVDEAVRGRATFLNERRRDLFRTEFYIALVYEGVRFRWTMATSLDGVFRHPMRAIREWLVGAEALRVLEADVERGRGALQQKASAFEVQLAGAIRLIRLHKKEVFDFVRQLANAQAPLAEQPLRYDTHVDYFAADSAIECHRRRLVVGNRSVAVLTMNEPPSRTFPHVLGDLQEVPAEFVACLEWRRLPADAARRDIHRRRRHFFNKRISLVNYVTPESRPDEMLVDESADATIRQLGDALTDIEVNGHFFGECALTVSVHDEDPDLVDRASAEFVKTLASHDGVFHRETYNLLNAWLAVMPGNSAHNLRRVALLETNCADLSFIFAPDFGERVSAHLGREALLAFETPHHGLYHFNLHVDDVGHTAVLGATGSGKSFLLNVLVTHAQKYQPDTVIFDLGHSYRELTTLLGGSYLPIGLRPDVLRINPFALTPSSENLHFLHAFVRVLLEGADGRRLTEAEDRELYEAIENVYVLDRTQRRLFTLANLLPRGLSLRLSRWVEGGRYARWFDHVDDTLEICRFQTFDFEGMEAFPELLEPVLFYVLHRVSERVLGGDAAHQLKVCVMDEAWRFIQHERLRAYVQEALKTWRKHNAAMILATQSADDFRSVDLLRTVIESCPTKLLLPNPSLDRDQYRDLFHLNATELELLAHLLPRKQLLMKRPRVAKVLTLNVDAATAARFGATTTSRSPMATPSVGVPTDLAVTA
jgi:type IV secretion system protein VirB4